MELCELQEIWSLQGYALFCFNGDMNERRAWLKWLVILGMLALAAFLFLVVFDRIITSKHRNLESPSRAAIHGFIIGMKSYQTEYNRLPLEAFPTKDDRSLHRTSGTILKVLLGKEATINPRAIPFIDPPEARDKMRGLYYDDKGTPVLVDQWGEPFYFVIDLNNDGKITNPDPRPDQPRELVTDIMVFSAGPDRDPNTWKDNITSW